MTRRKAQELGLRILGKHITTAVVGLPPRIMGIGPAYAIPAALKLAGISQDDVDIFEACTPRQYAAIVTNCSMLDQRSICITERLLCQEAQFANVWFYFVLLFVAILIHVFEVRK